MLGFGSIRRPKFGLVEESAAAAEALTHQAQQLAQAVAVFKIH